MNSYLCTLYDVIQREFYSQVYRSTVIKDWDCGNTDFLWVMFPFMLQLLGATNNECIESISSLHYEIAIQEVFLNSRNIDQTN